MHFIYFLSAIPALLQFSESFSPGDTSDRFKPGVQTGVLKDQLLAEASGIVASVKNKGYYWVINDSGNEPKLHLIDERGTTASSFTVSGCENIDWEDIAIYTDDEKEQPVVLIGDIGDNYAMRDHIRLISIPEPDLAENQGSTLENIAVYNFIYEDGARDSETLLVDPVSKSVYIVTKREAEVRLYKAPDVWSESENMILTFLASLPLRHITAGDISLDGTEILLKSYKEIYYWNRKTSEPLEKALSRKPELLQYDPEPQGEAIAWALDRAGFFTLSEKRFAPNQVLYFYERKGK